MEWDEFGNPILSGQEWDENGNPVQAAAPSKPAAPKRKPSILGDINAGIEQAADWATLGGFSNYRAAADSALSGGKEGFLDAKARNAAAVEDFNQRRPIAGVASKTVGGVAPALLTMGSSQALQATRTAPQGFIGRRLSDAASGAGYGAIAGANQAVGMEDPQQMVGTIAKNAAFGAAAGPIFGGGMEAGAKVGSAAANLLNRVKVDPNVVGMSGGNIRMKPKTPSTRDMVAKEQLKLAKQAGVTPEQMRADYAEYANAGVQPTQAQLLRQRGLQRGRNLANSPGKTPDLARNVIDEERMTQLPRAVERTEQAFGPGSANTLLDDITARKQSMGDVYNNLFNAKTQIAPGPQAQIERALKRVPELAQAQAALKASAQRDGIDPSTLSKAQEYKYIKEYMDGVIQKLETQGMTNEARRAANAQRELVSALEAGVPGYKAANEVYSKLAKQEEAVAFGRSLLVGGRSSMKPADLRAYMASLSRQEKEAVQAGLRDDLERILLESSGSVDAPRNVVAAMKNSYAEKIRVVLGDRAESYIKALGALGKSYREQAFMYPGSGSNTFAAQQEGAEAFLNIPPTKQGLMRMVDEAAGAAWTKATTPWREKMRDQQGELLFSRMSQADLERIASELAFQQEAQRQAALVSRNSGLFGAQLSRQPGQQ